MKNFDFIPLTISYSCRVVNSSDLVIITVIMIFRIISVQLPKYFEGC